MDMNTSLLAFVDRHIKLSNQLRNGFEASLICLDDQLVGALVANNLRDGNRRTVLTTGLLSLFRGLRLPFESTSNLRDLIRNIRRGGIFNLNHLRCHRNQQHQVMRYFYELSNIGCILLMIRELDEPKTTKFPCFDTSPLITFST